jgi:hypothetical protein
MAHSNGGGRWQSARLTLARLLQAPLQAWTVAELRKFLLDGRCRDLPTRILTEPRDRARILFIGRCGLTDPPFIWCHIAYEYRCTHAHD